MFAVIMLKILKVFLEMCLTLSKKKLTFQPFLDLLLKPKSFNDFHENRMGFFELSFIQ